MSIKYHLRYVFRENHEELRIPHVREQGGDESGLASFCVAPCMNHVFCLCFQATKRITDELKDRMELADRIEADLFFSLI